VDGFENGAFVSDVTRRCKTKTTNQTSAHIREDITIEIRHNQDLVVIGSGVSNDLQASVVKELGIEFNTGEVLGDSVGRTQEKTITHLHDSGLVDSSDLQSSNILGILECKSKHSLTGLSCDKLDALHNTINYNVFNT
jgi:hypothetical protein